MIRWEEQPSGDWLGYSGEALVASATKRDENRWDWEVSGAGKPKGWRNAGHRTNEVDARRAADAYWDKWLSASALRPDLGRLAESSVRKEPRSSRKTRVEADRPEPAAPSPELDAALAKVADLQRRLDRAEARAEQAEQRATAAETRADAVESSAKERLAKLRAAIGE